MSDLHLGIPFEHYRATDGVNVSSLKHMAVSPLHYRHVMEHGGAPKRAFALGNVTHAAILEPQLVGLHYVTQPETRTDAKGKTIKFVRSGKYWEAFQERNQSRMIVTQSESDTAWRIQRRVWQNAAAAKLLDGGESEVSVMWTHPDTGVPCKCRIDKLARSASDSVRVRTAIVDIKTTGNIERFAADCYNYKYHWQAAFYQDAMRVVTGEELPVYFIAVEKAEPHDCVVYRVSDEMLQVGRDEYTKALERVVECTASGQWPGISTDVAELYLPPWAMPRDTEATEMGLDWQ